MDWMSQHIPQVSLLILARTIWHHSSYFKFQIPKINGPHQIWGFYKRDYISFASIDFEYICRNPLPNYSFFFLLFSYCIYTVSIAFYAFKWDRLFSMELNLIRVNKSSLFYIVAKCLMLVISFAILTFDCLLNWNKNAAVVLKYYTIKLN